jgi:hypothetical protein
MADDPAGELQSLASDLEADAAEFEPQTELRRASLRAWVGLWAGRRRALRSRMTAQLGSIVGVPI